MDRSDIRAKAFALIQRGNTILMHPIFEGEKLIGYRIPGGHIEFGEKSYDAVIREIKEELNTDITDVTLNSIEENIFVYEGKPGHEITFIYDAIFADRSFYEMEIVKGFEMTNGQHFQLFWIDPQNPPEGTRIFPEGVTKRIKKDSI